MDFSDSSLSRTLISRFFPVALLGVFVVLFHATFAALFQRWTQWDESLSHGLIVNAVFLYLLAQTLPWATTTRTALEKLATIALLALTSVVWFLFHLISITVLEQVSLLALLFALYAACYGVRAIWPHRLLLLLPLFSLPIWDGLTDTLVQISSVMVGHMIRLVGMPAIIAGNSITIPAGTILIADGCSGIRYFQISLALAFIVSLMNHYKEGRLLASLAIAATIGLATNWIRIFIIVIVGYETEMQSSLMHDHEYFGWALFAVIMLPALYFAPVTRIAPAKQVTSESDERPMLVYPLLALAIGPLLSLMVSLAPRPVEFKPAFTEVASESSPEAMLVGITRPPSTSTHNAMLWVGNTKLYAQVDRYERSSAQDKLVPYFARLFNNKLWSATEQQVQPSVKMLRLANKHDERIVLQWQWFQVGQFTTQSVVVAKLLQIPTLIGGDDGFSIYSVQTLCETSSCLEAQERLVGNVDKLLAQPPRLN